MDNGQDSIVHAQRLATAVALNNLEGARNAARDGADLKLVTAPLVLCATLHNNRPMVEFLLDMGFPVDQGNDDCLSPLAAAIEKNAADMALFLIERGAKAGSDASFLHGAIRMSNGRCAVIEALVKKADADINALKSNNSPTTPLSYAVIRNDTEAIGCLLNLGADPNIPSMISDSTALHFACQSDFNNTPDTIRRLLAAGADTQVRDKHGNTPAEVAQKRGMTGHAAIIDEHLKNLRDQKRKSDMNKKIAQLDRLAATRRRPFSPGA